MASPTIHCPHCNHAIELKGAKPGHYRPACPTCHEKFDLLIPNDPAEPARPSKLVPVAATQPPRSEATAPPQKVDRTQFFIDAPPQIAYDDLHGRLGGYEIVQKLGQGGMGSVYLARQLSLDRNVAVKTLSPTLASDPQFVARFTREAYAAAQLSHHNVVQIHDIGQDRGTNFFSMELVEGTNLASVVEKETRLDPITAVTYTLQAARGLKFAHEHGLIHRDVKPENLLLNKEGVVKVADLGLVKRAGLGDITSPGGNGPPRAAVSANATQLNVSMGTPAYMAPEQAKDAAKVDQRADIYSLGCTLYDLVTGRPPFSGKSAIEVITKHQTEAIIPPEKIVANVPRRLSEIIRKMTAKQPEARYGSMGEVVKELEDFLGVEHDGGIRATQDNVKRVEVAVAQFNSAPFAQIRRNSILAFYVASVLAFAIGALTLTPWLAGGAVAFALLATIAYQLTLGIRQRTPIFSKVRQLLFGAGLLDWITWLLGAALAVALLYFFGQLWVWVGVAVLAVFAGVSFHFSVDNVVATQREEPLADLEGMIREMRLKGVDEDGIRGFIAKFSGRNWEPFYEALFGYEAKIQARRLYGKGERGQDRKRHGVWRDWIIAWIDRKLDERKQHREERLLARLEARALEARGMHEEEAEERSRNSAARVVAKARSLKTSATDQRLAETLGVAPAVTAKSHTVIRPEWLDEDQPGSAGVSEWLEGYEKQSYFRRRFGGPFDILLGRRVRFALAAVILLGAGKWVQNNGVAHAFEDMRSVSVDAQNLKTTLTQKIDNVARTGTTGAPAQPAAQPAPAAAAGERERDVVPLRVPGVPDYLCDAVGSWNGLLAGALLLLSVVPYGHLMTVGVIAGCAIVLLGHVPEVPVLVHAPRWLTAAVGGGLALLSMLFLRKTDD